MFSCTYQQFWHLPRRRHRIDRRALPSRLSRHYTPRFWCTDRWGLLPKCRCCRPPSRGLWTLLEATNPRPPSCYRWRTLACCSHRPKNKRSSLRPDSPNTALKLKVPVMREILQITSESLPVRIVRRQTKQTVWYFILCGSSAFCADHIWKRGFYIQERQTTTFIFFGIIYEKIRKHVETEANTPCSLGSRVLKVTISGICTWLKRWHAQTK